MCTKTTKGTPYTFTTSKLSRKRTVKTDKKQTYRKNQRNKRRRFNTTHDHYTVKRDKTVKIALDARAMNKNIKKDKYQMPNFYDLLNTLAETITSENGEKVWFASVDLKNAFGQVKVKSELAKHCNFAIIGGGGLLGRLAA